MDAALPLRIDWTLVTPWCPPALGLHLDGLIGFAMLEEAEAKNRSFTSYDELLAELPFARHESLAGWCWKASLVRPAAVLGSERRYSTAKTSTAALAARTANGQIVGRPLTAIDTVRGPFKNDEIWYTLEHVEQCSAWCVGDPDRIVSLLDYITHLGKRGRLDHGRIDMDQTHVVEDATALTRWQERQMPEPLHGYVPIVGRLQPPYWQGEGAGIVWRPES